MDDTPEAEVHVASQTPQTGPGPTKPPSTPIGAAWVFHAVLVALGGSG
jgi:hypothetical protein